MLSCSTFSTTSCTTWVEFGQENAVFPDRVDRDRQGEGDCLPSTPQARNLQKQAGATDTFAPAAASREFLEWASPVDGQVVASVQAPHKATYTLPNCKSLNFWAFQPLALSEPTRNARPRRGRAFIAWGDDKS
jgi:hypothetical protein